MAGELSFLTILEEVVVVVVVAAEEGVVVVLVVLIWNAMSVVSLGILLVNAVYVEAEAEAEAVVAVAVVQEEDVAEVLDTAEVQVMAAGLNIESESCISTVLPHLDFVNSSPS